MRDGGQVKCVVWDLDETLWRGTLLEDVDVELSEANRALMRILDDHGILQSVVSRNDAGPALERLRRFQVDEYLLHPQIGWGAKSAAVKAIVAELGIASAAVVFVDDSEFERAEVASELPDVRCVTPEAFHELVHDGCVLPARVTPEARRRRAMYRSEERRREHQSAFTGTSVAFLKSLGMRLEVRPATEADLDRAAELTARTHQLNTTGITFDRAALERLLADERHEVLVSDLEDRFGAYGTIGLVVVEAGEVWCLRLLLMSCRALGRNIGVALIAAVVDKARAAGAGVVAHFRPTECNRQMLLTYRLLGFRLAGIDGDVSVLALPPTVTPAVPGYVELVVADGDPTTPVQVEGEST